MLLGILLDPQESRVILYLPLSFEGRFGDDGGRIGSRVLWRPASAKKGRQVLECFRLRVTARIRQLARNRAERVGLTRFFRNPSVTVQEIMETAGERTGAASAGRHVLLIEDTSEVNYQAKAGRKRRLGRVGNGSDVGLFVHPALALDAEDGTILGLAGATIWRRLTAKHPDYQELPIEAKESYRWVVTPQMACRHLDQAAMVTVVADREADIYEMFARLPDVRTHLLVRSTHDRAVVEGNRLFAALASQEKSGEIAFDLPARRGRPARSVRLALRFARVTLKQPKRGADPRDPPAVTVYAVEAREIDPPSPKDAILWRLLTSHPVTGFAEAVRVVELYRRRWAIEQLFRTLKSQGIDLEASLIADGEALECLAATALLAATMVLQLVHARGEAGWTLPAARVFPGDEIAALHAFMPGLEGRTAKQRNPHPVESLAWAAWAIARLGGWSGYASERPPGPITFSDGLKRFQAMAEGFALGHKTIH